MKNGASLPSGVTADAASLADRQPSGKDRNVEEWAAVLSAMNAPLAPAPTRIFQPEEANAWRDGDGRLTPEAGGASDPTREAADGRDTSRVDLKVDAADLGEIAIGVDRSEGAVRVTIAVPDERAARAVEPEKMRLLSSLAESGVRVDSVTVVRAGPAGTALAPRTSLPSGPGRPAHSASSNDSKRPKKKNHFVG